MKKEQEDEMKDFDTRSYSINDFVEWEERKQLVISPKFQRRSVWSPQAKSYLIDTIIKGKPLPKIFIRATTDPKTKKTVREVVDGQQRIGTILSFIKDGFKISKVHNEEYGGKVYSELPESVQADFLKYELSVDLLMDLSDRDILDIFARLNTYSVSLNKQELYNAKYFGYFKQLVYSLGGKYYTFWVEKGLFTDRKIMRMAEAELVTDLLIAMISGIDSKKNAEKYYQKYDEVFDNRKEMEQRFDTIMSMIGEIYGEKIQNTCFKTIPNFYGLFLAFYHMNYGISNINMRRKEITSHDYEKVKNSLDEIDTIITNDDIDKRYIDFVKSTKDATTDVPARKTRIEFIVGQIINAINIQ